MVDIRAGSEEMSADMLEGESTSVRRASIAKLDNLDRLGVYTSLTVFRLTKGTTTCPLRQKPRHVLPTCFRVGRRAGIGVGVGVGVGVGIGVGSRSRLWISKTRSARSRWPIALELLRGKIGTTWSLVYN